MTTETQPQNLVEALISEMNRVREVLKEYEANTTGRCRSCLFEKRNCKSRRSDDIRRREWQVAEWFETKWIFLNDIGQYRDEHFDKIHEERISEPMYN